MHTTMAVPAGKNLTKTDILIHLGLQLPEFVWTVEGCKQAILAHHKKHGKVPNTKSGCAVEYLNVNDGSTRTFANMNVWLARRGSSISKLVDELGLGVHFEWSIEICKVALLAYYKEHGMPPTGRKGDASKRSSS